MHANDYQSFLQDKEHGLTVENTQSKIPVNITLFPLDWQAFKASYINSAMDREAFLAYKKQNKGVLHFSFKLFLPEQNSLERYFAGKFENPQEALLYSEYDLKDDFILAVNNDSITAMATHHQPSFGLKPYEEFIVIFDTKDEEIENKAIELVYKDYLFELGNIHYSFSEETMKNIPELTTK